MTGMKMPRLEARKTSQQCPCSHFQRPSCSHPSQDGHNSECLQSCWTEILGARPHSARRGCTSTSFTHSFLVAGENKGLQGCDSQRCTKESALLFYFSPIQNFPFQTITTLQV